MKKGRGGWEEKPRTDQEALCGDGVCCESSEDSDDRSNLDFVVRKGAPFRRSCRASDNLEYRMGLKICNHKPLIQRADAECGEAVLIDQRRDQCKADRREAEQPKLSCRMPTPSAARPS